MGETHVGQWVINDWLLVTIGMLLAITPLLLFGLYDFLLKIWSFKRRKIEDIVINDIKIHRRGHPYPKDRDFLYDLKRNDD